MKACVKFCLVLISSVFILSGCDQMPGNAGSASIAVLDLAAVAKATGQDEVIRQQADAARAELGAQLQQLVANMDQQLNAEREKAGAKPSEADSQRLQELTMQARQQINNAQSQAQNQANQFESNLVAEFRTKVDPLAEKIAKEKGASAVLAADAYLFWFDPAVDITDEVIAAWRAMPAAQPVAAPADDVAEVQSELDQVEGELAQVEEEIVELQEALEESQE